MAPTSSTSLAAVVALALCGALCGAALPGCEQSDDVVATLSALEDAGGELGGSLAPPPPPTSTPDAGGPRCETSQLYVLLSSIERNQCRVSSSPSTLAALGAFFLQNPPTRGPAEMRPVSTCDILNPLNFAYRNEQGEIELCPDHCETVRLWVAAENPRVLECQGFGGG